jgi:hypothetical protein
MVQNRFKGMELGSQLGPQSRHICSSIQLGVENQKGIHIHILHHKGY